MTFVVVVTLIIVMWCYLVGGGIEGSPVSVSMGQTISASAEKQALALTERYSPIVVENEKVHAEPDEPTVSDVGVDSKGSDSTTSDSNVIASKAWWGSVPWVVIIDVSVVCFVVLLLVLSSSSVYLSRSPSRSSLLGRSTSGASTLSNSSSATTGLVRSASVACRASHHSLPLSALNSCDALNDLASERGIRSALRPVENGILMSNGGGRMGSSWYGAVERGRDCAICLELFTPGKAAAALRCGHAFHTACASRWLRRSLECPLCRQSVV